MKKIKLLTPIVGLTTITSIALPLSSCSCNPTASELTIVGEDEVKVGSSYEYKALDKNGNEVDCSWSVNDETIATNTLNVLTPLKEGSVTFKAISKTDGKEASLNITVTKDKAEWDIDDSYVYKDAYGYVENVVTSKTGLSTLWWFKLADGHDTSDLGVEVTNLKGSDSITANAEIEALDDNYFNINITFSSDEVLYGKSLTYDIVLYNSSGQQKTFTGFTTSEFTTGIKIFSEHIPSSQNIATLSDEDECDIKPIWKFWGYSGDTLIEDFDNITATFYDYDGNVDNTITAQTFDKGHKTFGLKLNIKELSAKSNKFNRVIVFKHKDYSNWKWYATVNFNVIKDKSQIMQFEKAETDDYAILTKCNCTDSTVTIPSETTIDGKTYPVKVIDKTACENVPADNISIPSCVEKIEAYAFERCYHIKNITLPPNITSVEYSCFRYCESLESITIPRYVEKMYSNSFADCFNLKTIKVDENNQKYSSKDTDGNEANCVWYTLNNKKTLLFGCSTTTIPTNIEVIGQNAFLGQKLLTSITIPSNVTRIENDAFKDCYLLTSIDLSGVTYIGTAAFEYCTLLSNVTFSDDLIWIGDASFDGCTSLSSITIPNKVEYIGKIAFRKCTSLTSVTIPASVTNIYGAPFIYCTGLTELKVDPANTVYTSQDANGVECNYIRTVGSASKIIQGIASTTISNDVMEIGEYSFAGFSNLTTISIPDTVVNIAQAAFETTGLTEITIPSSVVTFGSGVFDYCEELTTVNLNEGLTAIPAETFGNCVKLKNITLPSTITSIGVRAFKQCEALESITIPANVTVIGKNAFYESGLKSATFKVTEGWIDGSSTPLDVSTPEKAAAVLLTRDIILSRQK